MTTSINIYMKRYGNDDDDYAEGHEDDNDDRLVALG